MRDWKKQKQKKNGKLLVTLIACLRSRTTADDDEENIAGKTDGEGRKKSEKRPRTALVIRAMRKHQQSPVRFGSRRTAVCM
uniref:Putative secreted protein n=1 Tax=Anopheles marajoara TaxID=58244 RepID=A0A2M4CBI4_9DIPT